MRRPPCPEIHGQPPPSRPAICSLLSVAGELKCLLLVLFIWIRKVLQMVKGNNVQLTIIEPQAHQKTNPGPRGGLAGRDQAEGPGGKGST